MLRKRVHALFFVFKKIDSLLLTRKKRKRNSPVREELRIVLSYKAQVLKHFVGNVSQCLSDIKTTS